MAKYSSEARGLKEIVKEVSIVASPGSWAINVFQLFGSVRIVDQFAEITEITSLVDCTNVYASLYDGTASMNLTNDGIDLSGAPVGTLFTKDKEVTQAYSVSKADQCRVNEIIQDVKIGKPFTVTQKSEVDTFLRFHLTTTDDPLSFKMLLKFVYAPLDGGYLELLL